MIRYGWLALDRVNVKRKEARAGDLLLMLACDRKRLKHIDGICVVAGPGSFSAVRTGVLYANLLSRLIRRPLVGVLREETNDLTALAKHLYDGASVTPYVSPLYDAEPNITTQKTRIMNCRRCSRHPELASGHAS